MNELERRGEALEKEFSYNEDLRFKIHARRNRLLGLWASRKLGKSKKDAEDYAREIVLSGLDVSKIPDILIRKIMKDFQNSKIAIEKNEILKKITEFLQAATQSIRDQ